MSTPYSFFCNIHHASVNFMLKSRNCLAISKLLCTFAAELKIRSNNITALDITVKPSIMKKIKIKRKDNSPIIGKKKSLTFTISSDLEQLSKASEKAFCINEVDSNEWSISYINDEMENNNEIIEFVFSIEDWNKTLNEVKAIYWKNDIIEDEFEFIAVTD